MWAVLHRDQNRPSGVGSADTTCGGLRPLERSALGLGQWTRWAAERAGLQPGVRCPSRAPAIDYQEVQWSSTTAW